MKSVKYLELVKQKHGLRTDTALASMLGITGAAISQYMKGERVMNEETCLAVAMALDINPLDVIMAAGIDRAEKTGQKSLWEVFMSKMPAVATTAAFAVAVNLFLTPHPAEAAPVLRAAPDTVYIM